MALPTWIYPLDPTGKSPDNFVAAEPVALDNHLLRVAVLKNGAFFTDSVRIVDAATMQVLTKAQWYATIMYPQPTRQLGMQVNAAIIISDPNVSPNILVDYQVVGGPYSYSQEAAATQIDNLNLDNRPQQWPNILNKPSLFPPAPHFQNFDTLFGMEYLVNAVYMLVNALQVGDAAASDQLLKYVDQKNANQDDITAQINQTLTAHVQNIQNPHQTTAAQVGAYTTAQVDAALANLQTTLQTEITANTTAINNHIANTNNPHDVTPAQLGVYTSAQTDTAIATAIAAAKLPFTPVQQGGGASQGVNKVYIGWATDASSLKAQVDSTDLGTFIMSPRYTSDYNTIWNGSGGINSKQPAGNYVVVGGNTSLNYLNMTGASGWLEANFLHSRGSGQIDGDLGVNGTIYCANDIWAFNSDRRFKDRIRPIDNVRQRIEGLHGVFHHYSDFGRKFNNLKDDREYVGFIAQDFENSLPQAVGLAASDRDSTTGLSKSGQNYLTAQYERTTPLLAEASKEHYQNHDALQERHDVLQERVVRLERLLKLSPESDCALLKNA